MLCCMVSSHFEDVKSNPVQSIAMQKKDAEVKVCDDPDIDNIREDEERHSTNPV